MARTKRNNSRNSNKKHSKKVQKKSSKFKSAALAVMASKRFENIKRLKEMYDKKPNKIKTIQINQSFKNLLKFIEKGDILINLNSDLAILNEDLLRKHNLLNNNKEINNMSGGGCEYEGKIEDIQEVNDYFCVATKYLAKVNKLSSKDLTKKLEKYNSSNNPEEKKKIISSLDNKLSKFIDEGLKIGTTAEKIVDKVPRKKLKSFQDDYNYLYELIESLIEARKELQSLNKQSLLGRVSNFMAKSLSIVGMLSIAVQTAYGEDANFQNPYLKLAGAVYALNYLFGLDIEA